jgi:hypothetical protein
MGLDLEPGQYLEMLKAEHEEHKKNPLSMRKVITCCALSKMPASPRRMRSATDLNPIDPACSRDRLAWIAVS